MEEQARIDYLVQKRNKTDKILCKSLERFEKIHEQSDAHIRSPGADKQSASMLRVARALRHYAKLDFHIKNIQILQEQPKSLDQQKN